MASAKDQPGAAAAQTATVPEGAVVVGVDGTDKDVHVVRWAAREAVLRATPLHLVHVVDTALTAMPSGDVVAAGPAVLDALEQDARTALAAAEEVARAAAPQAQVIGSVLHGTPTAALLEAARGAALLATGGGRKSTLQKILLGTTSLSAAMHSPCPTVLVAEDVPEEAQRNVVVVGVDGSDHSALALDLAFTEAALRGAALEAVAAWGVEVVDGAVVNTPDSPAWAALQQKWTTVVERTLGARPEQFPTVPVTIHVGPGRAPQVLTDRAAGAELLVIGSRGRGGFTGALLGSVGHRVLQTATCPVAVVRKP